MAHQNRPFIRLALFVVVLGLAALACNFPGQQATPDTFATAAAQTVAAQLTAVVTSPAETPPPAVETPTTAPPAEASPTATAVGPTATEVGPSPTPGTAGCTDRAGFIADVTVPDDTYMAPGEAFTKTWRLRNTGTCTWTTEYALVFDSGNIMGGPASVPLPGNVPPNATVDLSVDLVAPAANGTYRGNWKLRNADGVLFGLGASGNNPFWVQIIVGPTPTPKPSVLYDFTANYCDAEWRSGAGVLPCPGANNDNRGFVLFLPSPKLENGATENEPAIETHPQWVDDGVISGLYPEFTVQAGDRFKAVIGCLHGGNACNVKFQLNYRDASNNLHPLGEWTEVYDGNITKLDIDLSPLAGQTVRFALVVLANGSSAQDWAFWLFPRIEGSR